MEVGRIDEDGEIGIGIDLRSEHPSSCEQLGKPGEQLNDPRPREIFGAADRIEAGVGPQGRSGHPSPASVGVTQAQLSMDRSSDAISAGLSGA
jgi:hypothetical protein